LIVAAGEDAARLMLAHPRRFSPDRLAGLTRDLVSLLPVDARPRGTPQPALQHPVAPAGALSPPAAAGGRMPRAQRREQLLDVTLALLAEEGFEALSVEAVARRAGVNRVVVYRSFANLQVLLVSLLRREDARTRVVLEGLLPASPAGRTPAQLLGEALAGFLGAVVEQPQTWRVALLRPESAPIALQKLVNRRRSQLAHRLEPLVRWGLAGLAESPTAPDIEILARMLLSVGEEQGRLALDDPEFPPARLLSSSWTLLDALPLEA
jgi:AcrR family transcriptional regulator